MHFQIAQKYTSKMSGVNSFEVESKRTGIGSEQWNDLMRSSSQLKLPSEMAFTDSCQSEY